MPSKKLAQKVLKGIALRDSLNQTVPILVTRIKSNLLYQKRYLTAKKYLAQTDNPIKKGQKVSIAQARPISKNKSWKVVK